jgi:hypothetical protein
MVSMMNTTTLLAVCLASFTLVGVDVAAPGRATSAQVASEPTAAAKDTRQAIPAPEALLVTSEVVVVGQAPAKAKGKGRAKSYVCHVETLEQGSGQVKACVWK